MNKVFPQTIIENIGKNCCLVHCYIYCVGIAPSVSEYFRITLNAITAGVDISGVAPDCTVENAELFLNWLTGKRWHVTKKLVSNIKNIKEPTPVQYKAIGYTPHFVVVENGEIVFDGYENSKSVALGDPASARVITLA